MALLLLLLVFLVTMYIALSMLVLTSVDLFLLPRGDTFRGKHGVFNAVTDRASGKLSTKKVVLYFQGNFADSSEEQSSDYNDAAGGM